MDIYKQKALDKIPFVPSLFKTLAQGYSYKMLFKDFSAGCNIAVIALPLSLAFSIASGLTPEKGLYSSIVASLIMAFLSGSNFQICGPTGALVVIIFTIISRYGYDGLIIPKIISGTILIFCGITRLGFLIKYIPYPVTIGFTLGIALLIFSSQVKDFFGLPMAETPPEFFDKWHLYLRNALSFSPSTLFTSFFTLLVIISVRFYIPRFPAPVMGVIFTTVIVWLFDLPVETIGSRFGTLPSDIPSFLVPLDFSIERLRILLPDAFTMALLIAIESLLSRVVADSMTGKRHNSNMELIAQGVGNIGSVLFNGMPATGSIGRTMTNIRSGAYSPISSIFHAIFLFGFILYLMPAIELIPLSAFAGVLVVVAYDMSDLMTVRRMFYGPTADWALMLLTFILTVVLDLTTAVYVGVILASLFFMGRMGEITQLQTVTKEYQSHEIVQDIPVEKDKLPKGVHIFSINGPLFFGVADRLQKLLEAMETTPKVFILYLHNMPTIDMTAIHTLESFIEKRRSGCKIFLADIHPATRSTLDRAGIIHAVGKENIFPTLQSAVEESTKFVEDTA